MKYAVKLIKNTFHPLKTNEDMEFEQGQKILVLTEKGEEDIINSETDKISILFVNNLFQDIQNNFKKNKDPLNTINIPNLNMNESQLNTDFKTPQKTNKNTSDKHKISIMKSSKKK